MLTLSIAAVSITYQSQSSAGSPRVVSTYVPEDVERQAARLLLAVDGMALRLSLYHADAMLSAFHHPTAATDIPCDMWLRLMQRSGLPCLEGLLLLHILHDRASIPVAWKFVPATLQASYIRSLAWPRASVKVMRSLFSRMCFTSSFSFACSSRLPVPCSPCAACMAIISFREV